VKVVLQQDQMQFTYCTHVEYNIDLQDQVCFTCGTHGECMFVILRSRIDGELLDLKLIYIYCLLFY
jgi:hypothetical protein